jgi:hypothetical protein
MTPTGQYEALCLTGDVLIARTTDTGELVIILSPSGFHLGMVAGALLAAERTGLDAPVAVIVLANGHQIT